MLDDLKVKIFADGANLASILELNKNPYIKGFTSNPTLMKKDGVKDYKSFAKEVLTNITDKPFSFEVFADDFEQMKLQAQEIASWANNVYVKIPVTNTKGEYSYQLINFLSHSGVKVNVTAVFTLEQALNVCLALKGGEPSVLSIFAGRIADTGVNPSPIMVAAKEICNSIDKNIELLWASPRELYNIIEANKAECDIITVGHDLLNKLKLFGKNLNEFSLETVKMFYNDALKAGYSI